MLCPLCMSHNKTKGRQPLLNTRRQSDIKGREKSHTIEGFSTIRVLDPNCVRFNHISNQLIKVINIQLDLI